MRESDIQKLTMVALSKAGCKVFRANAGKFLSLDGQHVIQGLPNGFFDLFGFRVSDHQMFFIEMKTKTGRPRESQKNSMRCSPIVVSSMELPEALKTQ
ncbi:VRR-NUC domain-containing protein [Lactobacillus delbrueckii]|uniref:VRR-NUC domain-containing protein n=1 Tax=Lactobacillus delbrueckii TaxID=1584 RepID=UPI003A598D1F